MLSDQLVDLIVKNNPWLENRSLLSQLQPSQARIQNHALLSSDFDDMCLLLMGPRQAGKTTLGKYLASHLVSSGRFAHFLYLNMDFAEFRQLAKQTLFIDDILQHFQLDDSVIFIDEVQRLENPGLLLKSLIDLQLPHKLIASGSSQLELKSKAQEFLTGRNFSVMVLPLSFEEIGEVDEQSLLYGCYPKIYLSKQKSVLLSRLFDDYINKDIIEILQISKPDVMRRLISLLAHSSGQLVNYQHLATDCQVSIPTIQQYCHILEQCFTLVKVTPFVANKRKEIVTNPVYYFIDNGFRNQALRRFSSLDDRDDLGLLVESAVFQEIYKMRAQHFLEFDVHFWRTQNGAEVDFVLYKNQACFIPIEVKYRHMQKPTITKALRSFITAYEPQQAYVITRGFNAELTIENCQVQFVSFRFLLRALQQWRQRLA